MSHQSILRPITNSSLNSSSQRTGENAPLPSTPSTPVHVRRQREKHLQDKLYDESAKNDDLYTNLSVLKREIDEKNRRINQLNDKISDLRNELSNSVDKSIHDDLLSRNEELSSKLESITEQEKLVREIRDELEKENFEMRDQLDKLMAQITEIENLRNQLKESNDERDILVEQTKEIIAKLRARDHDSQEKMESLIQNYEEKIAFLSEQIESFKPGANCSFRIMPDSDMESSRVEQPESLGFFHEMKANDLSRENDLLQENIRRLSEELDNTRTKLTEAMSTHEDQLQIQLLLEKEKSSLQTEISSLRESIDQLKSSLSSEQATLQLCLTERNALIDNEKDLNSQIAEANDKIVKLKSEIDMLHAHIKSINDELAAARSSFDAQLFNNQFLKEEMENLKNQITTLQNELTDKTNEEEMHTLHLSELERRNDELTTERGDLENQLRLANDEIAAVRCEIESKNEMIDLLTYQLEEKDKVWKESIARLSEGLKENNLLKDDLVKKDAKIKELVTDTEKMSSVHQDRVKYLQASHNDLKLLVDKIEAMNSTNKEKIEKLEIELSQVKNDNRRLASENEQLRKLKVNNDDLKQLEETNKSLLAHIEAMQEKEKRLECDLMLTEESFQAERECKNRYWRDITRLECELKKAQEQKPACNTQIIMPTTININSDNAQSGVAIAQQMQQNVLNAVAQNDEANVFKRPALPSSRCGRESAASNSSIKSDIGSLWTPSQSIVNSTRASEYFSACQEEDRLSVLRERNKKQPMHLKSSYAAELQNLPNDENIVKAICKPNKFVPEKADQTFTVTETTTTTTTTREMKMAASVAKDMMKKAKGISPGSRSVFRRALPRTWSPNQKKPTNEIPY